MKFGRRFSLFLLVLPIVCCDAFLFDFIKSIFCALPFFEHFFDCDDSSGDDSSDDNEGPEPTPTASPTEPLQLEEFKGISDAYSVDKGIIEIDWEEFYVDFDGISFDVFVALGEYNYTFNLMGSSVDVLVDTFKAEPTFQHFKVTDTNEISVETPYLGEEHTLLVTANMDGSYISNTRVKTVVAATVSPHVRDGVNVVGVFVPTLRLAINMDDVVDGTEHTLSFTGPVSLEAQSLSIEDIVSGFTSNLEPFSRKVVGIAVNTPRRVVLQVLSVPIEDIFDELDLDSSLEVSRGARLVSDRRELFINFKNVLKKVKDKVLKPVYNKVVKPIGDAVSDAVEALEEFFEKGEFEASPKFSLVDIDESFDFKVLPNTGNNSVVVLQVKGRAYADVSLNAVIRVRPVLIIVPRPSYFSVTAKANYLVDLELSLSGGASHTYPFNENIWKGKKFSRWLLVGPFWVEVYAQPVLDVEVLAQATLTAGVAMGLSSKGGTSVGAIYDKGASPKISYDYKRPENDFDHTFPTLTGTASFVAEAGATLSLEAGVYGGMLSAKLGLWAGLNMRMAGGFYNVGDIVLGTVSAFEMGAGLQLRASASVLFGAADIIPSTPLFDSRTIIFTLPTAELELAADHRCLAGDNGGVASFALKAKTQTNDDAWTKNEVLDTDWYIFSPDGWSLDDEGANAATFVRGQLGTVSPEPEGTVIFAMQPEFPPLKVIRQVSLDSLFPADPIPCDNDPTPCDENAFFDKLAESVGEEFNTDIFLSQPPNPNDSPIPSTVYKFEDFMVALKKLQNSGDNFQFWLGDDCSAKSQKAAFVNMAAFLGQAMRETIIYDACDENNWDLWRADIFKEPTSPPENLPSLYPMSSSCGQLGQNYAEYRCEDECPQDLSMELTATTNAGWEGAPPPLVCGPKSKYDGLGYWNPQQFCGGQDRTCVGEPFFYEGQKAGVHISVNDDERFPDFFYTNPLPDRNGFTPEALSPDKFPATNVEGCCWWGRGVIQTTGRCNFGKLNKSIGAGAGSNALYPSINFCQNPQAVCTGPADLKWVAGIFFWVTEPQSYDRDGYNFIDGIKEFVDKGCADVDTDPSRTDCDFVFEYASGIVNRGCHDPGDGGCPDCVPGATCDPAHNVPERVAASKQALRALLKYMS